MLYKILRSFHGSLRQLSQALFMPPPRKHLVAVLSSRQPGGHGKRSGTMVFHEWFAWYPVWPEDERGIFWLEPVWIRYSPACCRWSYRSFRTEQQKQEQLEREYPF